MNIIYMYGGLGYKEACKEGSFGEISVWKQFLVRLNEFAIALDYDPIEELHARVANLERELDKQRSDLASYGDRVDRP